MKHLYIIFATVMCLTVSACRPDTREAAALVERVYGAGAASQLRLRMDPSLGESSFEIGASRGRPCITGSDMSALTAGIGWYFNHYAHANVSWNQMTMDLGDTVLPVPQGTERRDARQTMRYYLNYCTFSYSMAFWNWDRWAQEIDWMALHGINMPLMMVGIDCVWRDVLLELGYSEEEISEFVAGPGFQAWWLMNNLQGYGGPNPQWWYEREASLCRNILGRMRALGIEPVLPGYSGSVPCNAAEKLGLRVDDPGKWQGFDRPAFLSPLDEDFGRIAALYYEKLAERMGTSRYYSMDPFHEGGKVKKEDIGPAYTAINDAMHKAVPGSKWVIQSWQENPRSAALDVIPTGDFLVLDLFSDGNPKWKKTGYKGHDWFFCELNNFGGRSGIHGRLRGVEEGYWEAVKADPEHLKGIGATPEGILNNPVVFDHLFELPWLREDEMDSWLAGYVEARYGVADADALAAWELIAGSALDCRTGQQGPSEPIVCAYPSFTVDRVSTWSTSELYYDPEALVKAKEHMDAAAARLGGNLNFRYDSADLNRQIFTDSCIPLLDSIRVAHEKHDIAAYDCLTAAFLKRIGDIDAMLSEFEVSSYPYWAAMARSVCDEAQGTTDADRDWMVWNLRTQITTWTPSDDHETNHLMDYSNREWSGLLMDYYYPRWEKFFEENR